jgi:serine protease AprX
MRRIALVISALALFCCSAFGKNPKLDQKLNDIINGHKNEKVRVIIQRRLPISQADNDEITRNGGKVFRTFNFLHAQAVELPVAVLEKFSTHPNVLDISIDERLLNSVATTEASIVSGAAQATQTYGVTGAGIGVAVIDSGIAVHPDLPNVVKAVDFVDSGRNGGYDPFGHGTHVAGTIAGNGAASQGAHKGSATGVNLIDLRVLDANGAGYTSDVIAAIEWAINNRTAAGNNGQSMNIRVLNLSLGHIPYESAKTDPLTTACRIAVQNGIVVVASAGNYGKDSSGKTVFGGITSPGNEPAVLTVGAVTTWGTYTRADDTIATYSSRGPTLIDNHLKPDVVAPGGSIVAAMSPGSYLAVNYPTLQQDGAYLRLSGTSMAAPTVSAVVALMLQANPSLKPNALKAELMFTAEDLRALPIAQGAGYLNAAGALNLTENINPNGLSGQYWLLNNGTGLNYSNVIAGWPAVWSQTIVWGDNVLRGNSLFFNSAAWANTIIWGDTIVWSDTIVWDETIVWSENTVTNLVDAETIVWADVEAMTIVWDDEL